MPDAPTPTAPQRLAKKVLLIGWDAADWKVITPLIEAGLMPTLEGLVERGVSGNLATLDPPLSPMLWTSIATGKTADQHGILGFVEPRPDGAGTRPVWGSSRKCKALWNILNQSGMRSNVVGWWPSFPAEPLNGAMVSNFYQIAQGEVYEPWAMPPGIVHPPELASVLSELRVHPGEITAAHILPFVPRAAEESEQGQRRLGQVAKILADASTVQAAATYLIEHTEWDFTAVYFDAIDHFGHAFMKYHPPKLANIPEKLFELYQGVVTAGYRFHDMMLQRLLELAGKDTTVLLLSDHGFHSDHLRPLEVPEEPAGPAAEHRHHGIFVLAGPGVKQQERIFGANLLNIAPTVLTLFGLPLGRDMSGIPLMHAFETPPSLDYVDSWEQIDGDTGQHDASVRIDTWAEQEAMKQLVELGYVDEGGSAQEQTKRARQESQFYLARVHQSHERPAQAAEILRTLFEEDPEQERFGTRLVHALMALRRFDEAEQVLERVAEARAALQERRADKALQTLEEIEKAAKSHPQDPAVLDRLRARQRSAKRALTRRNTPAPGIDYLRGVLHLAQGRLDEAQQSFKTAEANSPHFPALRIRLGEVYLKLENWDEAARAFSRALTMDPDNPHAHRGLALTRYHQRQWEDAANAALRATELQYFYPSAHYILGEALMRLGLHEASAQAFEVALVQDPTLRQAHTWLAELYRLHLDAPAKAASHLRMAASV